MLSLRKHSMNLLSTSDSRQNQFRICLFWFVLLTSAWAYSFQLTSFLHAKEGFITLGLLLFAGLQMRHSFMTTRSVSFFSPAWVFLLLTLLLNLLLFPCHVPSAFIIEWTRITALLLLATWAVPTEYTDDYARHLHWAILISVGGTAILGLGQYLNLLNALLPPFQGYTQRIYSVFGNQDLLGGYLAIGIPLAVYYCIHTLNKKRLLLLYPLLLLLCTVLILTGSRSAWLAAAAGCGAILHHLRFRSLPRPLYGLFIAVILVFLAVPGTMSRVTHTFQTDDIGGNARLWFWDGALRMFRDAPLIGVGMGNFSYWSPHYLGEALQAPGGIHHYHNELDTSHAHCDPLQLVDEAGLVGLCCAGWVLARLYQARGPEWGCLVALGTFSLFNNPFHSAPHALIGFICIGLLLARKHSETPSPHTPLFDSIFSFFTIVSIPLAIALSVFFCWAVLLPSYQLRKAEDAHLAHHADTLTYYKECIHHSWFNATAHDEYGLALLDAGYDAEARRQFELALGGLDTGRIYLALGRIALKQQDYQRARMVYEKCLWRWPSNQEAQDAWHFLVHAPDKTHH